MAKEKLCNISFRMNIEWDEHDLEWHAIKHQNIENSNIDDTVSRLKDTVRNLIPQMKDELNKFSDNAIVEIKVDSIYSGSVIALFTVIWDAAKTVKDAYDIVKMITDVSELFMKSQLKEKIGYKFHIYTYSLNKADERKTHSTGVVSAPIIKRDAFFYYLLIANIAQAVIIGALVFGAVTKMYF